MNVAVMEPQEEYCRITAPNILLVIADDLGWADIGFSHKPDGFVSDKGIPETPHLDRTAEEGLVLDNLYTQAACTPTRGSLMTGKYAFRLGQLFTSSVMGPQEKESSSHKFLSKELAERGYKVHGVGKWHLGHREKRYRPTERGFDSFYGLYKGMGTHYTHHHVSHPWLGETWGRHFGDHDFHYDYRNGSESVLTETEDDEGVHSTELFTKAAVSRIKEHDKTSPLFLFWTTQKKP
ncbi:arylsulfatase B-like [Bolinopsis microptera]|uniref:arylsulfatase B-like n=1 Tax=Bolinopsis microptera TaxID=2820187 RepID=UPI00307A5621